MPNFQDIPRELRDLIYAEALTTDGFLLALNEEIRSFHVVLWAMIERVVSFGQTRHKNDEEIRFPRLDLPKPSVSLALAQVSKQLYNEAMHAFCSLNTFQISSYPTTGKPSVFMKHVKSFQSVYGDLALPLWEDYFPNSYCVYRCGGDPIHIWK